MKKRNSILGATVIIAVLTVLGKVLGFGREALIAAYYGASAETDAFFFAQGMPDTVFPAVCSSISTAFVSLYVKRLTECGEREGDVYASRVLSASTLLGVLLSGVGVLFAPLLVPLFAPGFSGTQLTLAVHLTRLVMGAFVLTMLKYILCAILNSKKFFIGSQMAGLLYNAVIILLTVLIGRGKSMDILTITVIIGMAMQVVVLALCSRGHFHYTLGRNSFHSETAQLLRLALPVLLGNSVWQLNNIVDKALGSMLPEGSLSALSYANSLSALVISVFVTSISTVLYPTLTSMIADTDREQYGKILLQGLTGLSLILIPLASITLLTASDIVDIVYARGSFDQTSVKYTSLVLACYAPQFLFVGIQEILTRGFFALQDTKTPARNSAIGVVCNIFCSLALVRPFGIAGIAVGTTISSFVSAALLLNDARRRIPSLRLYQFFSSVGKQLLAGAVVIAALLVFRQAVSIPWPILRFAADTAVGFLAYLLVLLPLHCQELQSMIDILRQELRR